MSITFSTGIPDMESLLVVDGYGLCQFRKHFENGDIMLYMGSNRLFTVSGNTLWRYAKY